MKSPKFDIKNVVKSFLRNVINWNHTDPSYAMVVWLGIQNFTTLKVLYKLVKTDSIWGRIYKL